MCSILHFPANIPTLKQQQLIESATISSVLLLRGGLSLFHSKSSVTQQHHVCSGPSPRKRRIWQGPIARNRILFEPEEVKETGEIWLGTSDSRAQHIRNVLRSNPGDVVRIGLINGNSGTAEVLQTEECEEVGAVVDVRLRVLELGEKPCRPRLSLLLAMPRPKSMRRLWSVLGQLGLQRIYITNAARVERFYFDAQALQPATVRSELLLGLEQVMRTVLPTVSVHLRLLPLLSHLSQSKKGFLSAEGDCEELGETLVGGFPKYSAFRSPPEAGRVLLLYAHPGVSQSISSVLLELPNAENAHEVVLAVGPEGGWTEYEVALLDKLGFVRVSLSCGPLRTDVALVALISLVKEALDDW